MRRQPMPGGPGGSGDEDSEEHASFAPTLTRLTTRAPVKPQTRSRPLLDHFLSLLATLAIPLQLSSLALATPTLLLTVLEALLETRLIEVEKGWRGSTDNQDKRYLLAVLLEAITQVWEVVTRRTSECQNGWVWRPDEIDVNKAVNGDEEEIARIVEAMLCIADALGLAEGRGGPSTPARRSRQKDDGQVSRRLDSSPRTAPLPSDTADVFYDSRYGTTSTSLFAPRPLRPRPPVVLSSADPRRSLASTSARDPTVAPLSPPSHEPPHNKPNSPSPLHRHSPSHTPAAPRSPPLRSPTSSTSFLATLSDPSSHLVDAWRERRPVPPLSPRKPGSAVAGESASWSVKEALKRLEAGRRVREREPDGVMRQEVQEEVKEKQAERARIEPVEPGVDIDEQPTTPPARLRPRPPRISDSRSSSSLSSESELAKSPLPLCRCLASPPRLTPATSASEPPPPRAQRRTTTPASARPRRIRLGRISGGAPLDSHTENAAFLSVHSSTDVEQSPRAIVSTLSPPSIDPNLANPPTSSPPPPQLPPNASRPLDDPPALSPYTVALLAKRDALRAKLAVLERREGDRQLLKDQG
ncbi:putative Chloride channel protein k [Rhodotorula toruloides ATCC 204091]|uniref:BY PROTMAP: gi/342319553/gb/EGU11501.1/ putative Chloride channel protein k [Rhodotorula glutinis ATCC 204091] n=1 Tax=Rhodotorula toruloides TaxID=5286 RepID=A0A0K3CTL7_RHOTO|nr:putative Chloride channel protein k [Rhodotorula toruloides ATCC 204091]KAK4330535.1 putative Chloride channel protein k [Rhodotorula toruloides]PRQ71204.1 hypothetical protein AAT19DRAFT_10744 [Rhodotorula toruloides]